MNLIEQECVLKAFIDKQVPGARLTPELSRRRDARDHFTGKARLKSPNDGRPDTTDGKYALPRDARQAPDTSERGAVVGRLQRLVGRVIYWKTIAVQP